MNKKLRKILTLACSAVLLVCLSVGATVAYLTDTEAVVNTFTVGNVAIKLDEAPVNKNGEVIEGARRQENEYKLLPGHKYVKDPTIVVDAESEDCYVIAKIDVTGAAALTSLLSYDETDLIGFAGFVNGGVMAGTYTGPTAGVNGVDTWTGTHEKYGNITMEQKYNGEGSYTFFIYFEDAKKANDELVLFNELVVPDTWSNDDIKSLEGMKISVTAYAVQKDGFDSAREAYNAGAAEGWKK